MQIENGPHRAWADCGAHNYEIDLPPVASRVLSCQDLNNQILLGTVRSECWVGKLFSLWSSNL